MWLASWACKYQYLVRKYPLEVISEARFKGLSAAIKLFKTLRGLAVFVVIDFAINAATEVSVAKLLERIINAIQHRDQTAVAIPLLVVRC